MGLFRKTLRDAKAFAAAGRWDEVKKIIEKHHYDELTIHTDFKSLGGVIDRYMRSIDNLLAILGQHPKDTKQFLKDIEEVERTVSLIEEVLSRLIRDKKLALE